PALACAPREDGIAETAARAPAARRRLRGSRAPPRPRAERATGLAGSRHAVRRAARGSRRAGAVAHAAVGSRRGGHLGGRRMTDLAPGPVSVSASTRARSVRALYRGWLGYGNLGDEALLDACVRSMPRVRWEALPFDEPPPRRLGSAGLSNTLKRR